MKENNLLYYNEYGGFKEDGKEYIIETSNQETPLPWSHIIANEDFGTLLTNNGGGYIWHKNSQANKITSWSNDSLKDTPSEILKLKLGEKEINILPYETLEKYKIIYGFGYAKYYYENEDVLIETLIYVPINKSKKVYDINIKYKKEISSGEISYRMFPVLGVTREFTKKNIVIDYMGDYIEIKNKYRDIYSDENIFIKASKSMQNFSDENNEVFFCMKLNDEKENNIRIEIGAINDGLQDVTKDMEEIETFWKDKMNSVKVYTPVESMNIMMNGWLLYQTLVCRIWARTSFYQAGGAFGFRDQLQDSLMVMWFDSQITRNQILYHAMHQFEEGDVLHWWHKEKNNGTRTRYTDDLLWLPYITSKYIEHTGDIDILEEEIPYVKSDILKDNEIERYTETTVTDYKDTLYNHCKKAIDYGVKLADNGLPQMGNGDWNDGMNKVCGQSIWLRFFYL